MVSEADGVFFHVHLDHMQLKLRSQDYAMTSGSAFGYKIQTVQEPELTAKMLRKCLFQYRRLKDIAYQEWVLKDKLDKHYAQCMACEIWLISVCSLLL